MFFAHSSKRVRFQSVFICCRLGKDAERAMPKKYRINVNTTASGAHANIQTYATL